MSATTSASVSRECACPEAEWDDAGGQWKVSTLVSWFVMTCSVLCAGTREALKFYEAALGSEPTSVVLWKRKVAVFKAMGDNVRAVNELNALLAV